MEQNVMGGTQLGSGLSEKDLAALLDTKFTRVSNVSLLQRKLMVSFASLGQALPED